MKNEILKFSIFVNNIDLIEAAFIKKRKEEFTTDGNLKVLRSNGLYYFKSFVAKYYIDDLSNMELQDVSVSDYFANLLVEFEEIYQETLKQNSSDIKVDSNTFKNDVLWEEMIATKDKLIREENEKIELIHKEVISKHKEFKNPDGTKPKNMESLKLISTYKENEEKIDEIIKELWLLNDESTNRDEKLVKIMEIINLQAESNKSKAKFSNIINNLLKNRVISEDILSQDIPFRTIRISNDENFKVYESFPLPRDSFMEFSKEYDINSKFESDFNFEQSELKSSLQEEMQYVILKVSGGNMVTNILIFKNILNEENILAEGKKFFDKLKEYFNNGNSDFKSINSTCFHVRPKARNSYDTFTFTNGDEVIKSTIWINKSKMKDIIEALINSGEN